MKPYFLLFYFALFFSSCSNIPPDVRAVLSEASSNRAELESVISHYINDPKDSLKLEAAYFLIRNMVHYHSIGGSDAVKFASTYRAMGHVPLDRRNILFQQYIDSLGIEEDHYLESDLQTITAKYLIENIESAFSIWESTSWSKNYSFELFCEYILPYRVYTEQLTSWRTIYNNKYKSAFENINFVAGTTYEAEGALLKYGCIEELPTASGGKGVRMTTAKKSTLELNQVTNDSGQDKVLLLRYFNGGKEAKQRLFVNKQLIGEFLFEETGNWEKPTSRVLRIPLKLVIGDNKIKLISSKNDVIIDQLELTEAIKYNLSIDNGILSGSIYRIKNKANNRVFTLAGNERENATPLVSETYNKASGQHFKIIYNDYGFYKFVPTHVNGKALDLFNFSKSNGGSVNLWEDQNAGSQQYGGNQEWAIIPLDKGYYKILSRYSGKCLETSETNNAVVQNDFIGGDNQKWGFELHQQNFNQKTDYLTKGTALDAASRLTDATLDFQWFMMNPLPPVNAKDLAIAMTGNCREEAQFMTYAARSLGIPVTIDYTPQWPFRSMGHEWNVVFDSRGKAIPYYFRNKPGRAVIYDGYRKAKVFRRMFSENSKSLPLIKSKNEDIPEVFKDPHIIDVTNEYVKTSTVNLTLSSIPKNANFSYLCIFNNEEWVPIFWSKIQNGKVKFDKMGRNVVYLPQYYINNEYIPAGDPFLLKEDGSIRYFKTNNNNKQKLVLTRKHPFLAENNLSKSRMNGGKFQGANKADFSDSITLCSFTKDTDGKYYNLFPKNGKSFKFLRYLGPPGSHCNINELIFFDANGNELKGEIIGTSGSAEESNSTIDKCFDKNILTGFDAPVPNDAWVGLRLDKPSKISKVRFMPRTDGNCIEPGDQYELVYWNDSKWKTVQNKIAKEDWIIFNNAPSGGLYLLHNRTKGKDERIFTYENNSQVWW